MDLGNAYASMGEYDNAVDAFSKALLLDPNNGEILFDIGCVYLLQERLKKCIEYYNKAEAAGYDNVRLYMNMAAIYNALEDKQMELRCYTKAIDKDPMMGELYVKKVMLFVDLQRYAEALETLDDMRKLFPDAFEGYDLAARIYSGQGHADEAIKILEEGLKKFPKDINLRISLITQYLDVNRVEDAENVIAELKKHEYADTFEKAILMQEVSVAATKNQPEIMFDLLSRVVKLEQEGECDEQARFMLMMTSILLKKYEVALEMAEVLERQNSKNSFSISGFLNTVYCFMRHSNHFRQTFLCKLLFLSKFSNSLSALFNVVIHKSSLPPLETNKSDYLYSTKKDARGNQYHKYCSFPLRLWCFHLTMCPYQVGCNLIVNRYILKIPSSECSFIIPSEYFLSIITRLHLSHLIPIF